MTKLRLRDLSISLILGLGLGLLVVASWMEMQELRLWRSIDISLITILPNATLFGLVHLVIGVSLFIYGIYNVSDIIRVNQRVQAGKNNPVTLLTTGYYSTVRHPMTGMFIMTLVAFMVSLSSILSLVFIFLFTIFFHVATLYEERTWLIPKFGETYLDYMRNVPVRYFSKRTTMMLLLLIGFCTIGIIL
jgi:protein-S-isoprenylcysteine O-methyltransferase Ste14